MTNGIEVKVNNRVFKIGTPVEIGGQKYQVYNTLPGLELVAFVKVNKNGKLPTQPTARNTISLSFKEIEKFMKLGSVVITENKPENIKVGTKVIKDGYEGTVTEVCEWDSALVVVRLQSGSACVGRSNFSGQYENNFIVEI